jgi:hypothetical protein
MMNNDKKEKQSIFPLSAFLGFFFIHFQMHTNVDKPTGNVMTFTHRKAKSPDCNSFFNHFLAKS